MNDEELLRYSRHILLQEVGIEGQARIRAASALVVGAGGLGSPASMYLACAGIGRLTLVDGDAVDLTNLQRQILHTAERIGVNKAVSGLTTLSAVNPQVGLAAVAERVDEARLRALVEAADVVLDCTDNFATRHAINRACVSRRRPLVSGAAVRFDGQLAVFDLRRPQSPCYSCLFPEGEAEDDLCAVMGVFAPLTGIVGAMQAAEALKLLAGAGTPSTERLLILDALSMDVRAVRFAADPNCAVCRPAGRG
ncbi:MAG: molybdopterin-synthase adenylyltransferase MoeB [Burkholderiaceae bacterium]|jgi:adenylyltransferase/sulfurtransferase|nr:molybdopterin-synthase adenylyltransferase MoeB [Burkholderiaceae bacterium]